MKPVSRDPFTRVVCLTALFAAGVAFLPRRATGGVPAPDPEVVGPEECAECHVEEFSAWEASDHQVGSQTLTRNAEAVAIARALGIRRVKSDARCTSCHYTVQGHEDPRAVAGVSCESCHGPAGDWLALHDDFGGAGGTAESETPEHREARLAACDAAGMHRPGRIHELASRCYECHVVGDEELVDVGGHPPGGSFELVCWSQGEVRHNYVRGGGTNAECSIERKRILFVLGCLLELEHSLRALASSRGDGVYAAAMAERARAAIDTLAAIDSALGVAPTARILELVRDLPLEPVERAAIRDVLDPLALEAAGFEEAVEGSDLAGLDPLLPPTEAYVGEPAP